MFVAIEIFFDRDCSQVALGPNFVLFVATFIFLTIYFALQIEFGAYTKILFYSIAHVLHKSVKAVAIKNTGLSNTIVF